MLACRVVVVMDGYHEISEKARLKKGRIKAEQAEVYESYKENVKSLILNEFSFCSVGSEEEDREIFYKEAEYGEGRSQNSISYKVTRFEEGRISFIEHQKSCWL